jgi:hypothetical protein
MPASLPGATAVQNAANPSQGAFVIFDLLSGPTGSPFDRDVQVPYLGPPDGTGYPASGKQSTGGLSTGIGFGSPPVIRPLDLRSAGFTDDYIPGVSKPDGTASADSTIMYIGGGKSLYTGAPDPYTAGFGIGAAGNGATRDAGAGPAFTGFDMKLVTAPGAVAAGAVVEAGWTNRAGFALGTGDSVFGSSVAATDAPA